MQDETKNAPETFLLCLLCFCPQLNRRAIDYRPGFRYSSDKHGAQLCPQLCRRYEITGSAQNVGTQDRKPVTPGPLPYVEGVLVSAWPAAAMGQSAVSYVSVGRDAAAFTFLPKPSVGRLEGLMQT